MVLFRFKSFFLVCLLLVSFLVVVLPVGAVDWLGGWEYRKEIVFDSVVDEGVQVTFNVTYSELNGHCQSDFGDLRFYYMNGTKIFVNASALVASDYVTCWCRSDGSDSLYVYYGNSEASSDWASASEVFEDVIGNVVLALPLDDNSSSVVDYSGYGNDGIVYNSAWVAGKYGLAINFTANYVSDYISIADDDSLDVEKVTCMAWVNVSSTVASYGRRIVDKERGTAFGWGVFGSSTHYQYFGAKIGGSVESQTFGSSTFNLNEWEFLAVSVNGTYINVYVDSVLKQVYGAVGDMANNSYALTLGQSYSDYNSEFDGAIDHFLMFDMALSDSQIFNCYSYYPDVSIVEGSVCCRVWVESMPSVSFGGEVVSNEVLQENLDFVYLLALLGVVCALGALCWVLLR